MRAAIAILALSLVAGCGDISRSAHAAKAQMGDPRAVVAATCTDAASPMCACIVDETVKTLQAGPREVFKLFESPASVWDDVVQSLDRAARDKAMNARSAAESNCKRRIRSVGIHDTAIRKIGNRPEARPRPKQSIHISCSSEGNSGAACECYELTLKRALSEEDYNAMRADAKFPPPLEAVPAKKRKTALATIASARSVCGLNPARP